MINKRLVPNFYIKYLLKPFYMISRTKNWIFYFLRLKYFLLNARKMENVSKDFEIPFKEFNEMIRDLVDRKLNNTVLYLLDNEN